MNREKTLRKKVASIMRKRETSGENDALLLPGERLAVIASFDVYRPGDIDKAFNDDPHVIMMPADADPRQVHLDELHGRLIRDLNEWAKRKLLLKEGEQVCVDVFLVRDVEFPRGEA